MVKLKRLKIERYRNVAPCDLRFGDGMNIVLGQNGAGKTTLLNLISKVLRTSLADTSDPFAIELELVFPGGSLSGRIATREPERLVIGFEHSRPYPVPGSGDVARMIVPDFDLLVHLDRIPDSISVHRGAEAVEWGGASANGGLKRSFSLDKFQSFSGLLQFVVVMADMPVLDTGINVLGALSHTQRFDEGLDTYRGITAKAEDLGGLAQEWRPMWFHVQPVLGEPLAAPFAAALQGILPTNLFESIRSATKVSDLSSLTLSHDRVNFLAETVRLLNLESAVAKFELIEKAATESGVYSTFGNLKFWFTRRDGSVFQDHQLSFGQKRLLAFLYYLDANPSFVIADELVNGMHHVWIDECVRAIGGRQAFLTSQNPLLLDYLTFESVEQVKSSFVVCRTELHEGRELMIWRNFTDDEADMFYRAYRVGIEHVGEILRTRGLW